MLQCGDVGVVEGVAGRRGHWELPMLLCVHTLERITNHADLTKKEIKADKVKG